MGRFVNPNNTAFRDAVKSEIHVDKSGLIAQMNRRIESDGRFIMVTRPRAFGKSMSADMLSSYYSKGADSRELFSSLLVSSSAGWNEHINRYDVIHLDIESIMNTIDSPENLVSYISRNVVDELRFYYPGILEEDIKTQAEALSIINSRTGNRFVIIIDGWDIPLRDYGDMSALLDDYFKFLRSLSKGSMAQSFTALSYMTGVLPPGSRLREAGLENYEIYSFIHPGPFSEYLGFTEEEVKKLCEEYALDYNAIKLEYGAYTLGGWNIYNPFEICRILKSRKRERFWYSSLPEEDVWNLIDKGFQGLEFAVITLISGSEIELDCNNFLSDPSILSSKEDVLLYLVYLGYLKYNEDRKTVSIPNNAIRMGIWRTMEKRIPGLRDR